MSRRPADAPPGGPPGGRRWTLRSRLLAAFLLLTLLPSFGLTFVILRSLPWALDRWASPGVRQTFENAVSVARDTLNRIENDLRQRWALSLDMPELVTWRTAVAARGAGPSAYGAPVAGTAPLGARLGARLNFDFVQLYPAGPESSWTPLASLTRDPLIDVPQGLRPWGEGTSSAGFFLKGPRGELAFAQKVPPGNAGGGLILAVGIYLDPTFYEKLADLNSAVERHEQLKAYASMNKAAVYVGSILFVVLLGATSILVAGRLSRSLSKPVEELARGMELVAHGDLQSRVEPAGSGEMKSLIDSFNAMTADLAQSKADLARAERAQAWQEAARRIAHEIRNPLQPITLALHRIEKSAAGEEPVHREVIRSAAASILDEVEALKRLAQGFSEYARMPDPAPEVADLGEFIARSVPLLEFPGAHVAFVPPPAPVKARIDRHQMRQVLTNLVKNAAEAMPNGGVVTLRVIQPRDGGRALVGFEVDDEGPGIPHEMHGRLFQPYASSKPEGTGLGLAIVERIVTAHGGRIDAGNRPEGGARFRVVLPPPDEPAPGRDGA